MPYYRSSRLGCNGVIARCVLVAMMGIVALICIANWSWFEGRTLEALYGDRPKIHLGEHFKQGASAVEDGVRQTAILVDGKQFVQVKRPTPEWRRKHKDAVCQRGTCTAAATPGKFTGSGSWSIGALLAGLLFGWIVWTLINE